MRKGTSTITQHETTWFTSSHCLVDVSLTEWESERHVNKMVLWPGCGGRAEFSLHTKNVRSVWFVVKRRACCCNLSGGVALIVWFTTNGMCVKNNTITYVARASNSKRDCDVVALPILTCERLNVTTSVRKERLRAWSLLLLAATVRSFVHMPLGMSDRNTLPSQMSVFNSHMRQYI